MLPTDTDYAYHRPTTIDEVLSLAAANPGATFVAGGTDLMVQLRKRKRTAPPAMISLRRVDALRGIDRGPPLRIGAAATLTELLATDGVRTTFPALAASIDVLGSRQIRNVATLVGNLCNASPGADTAPPLLVHGARVRIAGPAGERELPIDELFLEPGKTALVPGEIVTAVLVDDPAPNARATFLRRGRVKMDIAVASVAVLVELDGDRCTRARVAAGAVAPVPLRLRETEAILEGSRLDEDTLARAEAVARAEVSPITDIRSTADYRRNLVGVFVKRAARSLRGDAKRGAA